MTPKPLTPAQCRAAERLAHGATQAAVADELGRSSTSVRRLEDREDFQELMAEARAKAPADSTPDKPTPRSVLEEMLVATTKSGEPAKALRIQAAVALGKLPDESLAASDRTVERVYVTSDDPDHPQVIGILDATPPDESVFIIDAEDGNKRLADRDVPHAEFASVTVLGVSGHGSPDETPSPPSPGAYEANPPASRPDTPTDPNSPRGRGE